MSIERMGQDEIADLKAENALLTEGNEAMTTRLRQLTTTLVQIVGTSEEGDTIRAALHDVVGTSWGVAKLQEAFGYAVRVVETGAGDGDDDGADGASIAERVAALADALDEVDEDEDEEGDDEGGSHEDHEGEG